MLGIITIKVAGKLYIREQINIHSTTKDCKELTQQKNKSGLIDL
jgi:uncharacterized membrane protein YciS (DUF1049 family)